MPPMKLRRLLVLILCTGIICLIGGGAYFSGAWIPNEPSRAEYPVRGIDVSAHQGQIDWNSIPKDQIQFAYIKATEGGDFVDRKFHENWKASAAAGLRRGGYHFFTFKTDGLKQAENFIANLPQDPAALPPAVDLEFGGNSSSRPSPSDFILQLDVFVSKIRAHYGVEPDVYTTNEFKEAYLQGVAIKRLWIRSVFTRPSDSNGRWELWQYSGRTKVSGVSGLVDQNVFKGSMAEFNALYPLGTRTAP